MFCGIKQMSNYVGVLGNQVFLFLFLFFFLRWGGQWKQRYKCKNNGINLNTLNPEWKYHYKFTVYFYLKKKKYFSALSPEKD